MYKILAFFFVGLFSSCTDAPGHGTSQAQKYPSPAETNCSSEGIPEILAIHSAEGKIAWDWTKPTPSRSRMHDDLDIYGHNLCAGKLTLADGVHPAIPLPYKILEPHWIRVRIPWDRPRVDNSILFRTPRSYTRVDMSILPIDLVSRQIYINDVESKRF